MNGALAEPVVVFDAVFQKVLFKGFNVLGQSKVDKSLFSLLVGYIKILVPVLLIESLCVVDDVLSEISVLGHLNRRVKNLPISNIKGETELLYLIAGVVYIELPFSAVARPDKNLRQNIAQSADAGVANVHGTGGVGGYELHQHALALAYVGSCTLLFQGVLQYIGIVIGIEPEV